MHPHNANKQTLVEIFWKPFGRNCVDGCLESEPKRKRDEEKGVRRKEQEHGCLTQNGGVTLSIMLVCIWVCVCARVCAGHVKT